MDTGVQPMDSGPRDANVGNTCGDGIVDTETFETCDPAAVGTTPQLRCQCVTDNVGCTDDVWVPDPVQGQCFGACQHIPVTGYPRATCDDGNPCTNDTIVSGTAANCDLVCSHTPRTGLGYTTCDDNDTCTTDNIISGSASTCSLVCSNTQRTGYGITTCDDGMTCTIDSRVSGSFATCNPVCNNSRLALTDVTCDGFDDDCSGSADEDYVGGATTCGVGACASTGVNTCVNGAVVSTCVAGNMGVDNTCNGVDEDCNGVKDDGYVPLATVCGVGACASTGITSCMGGVAQNSCVQGMPAGSDTTCNNVDDDCNGMKDDGYVRVTVSCGVGACAATGLTSCVGGSVTNACTPGIPAATDATCNNIDDDCDGARDDDFATTPTTCGTGACASSGTTTCSGGTLGNSCTAGTPAGSDTTCNNVDDDCNGTKDDGYVVTATACGTGACARTGANTCVAGAVVNSCVAGTAGATDTTCNNIDDDCNGARDDGFMPSPTNCGTGACARTGTTSCFIGVLQNSCMPGPAAGSDTTCNNVDDDCNGFKDEGYVQTPTSCGTGSCAANGMTTCTSGTVGNSCVPNTPAATDTTCNNQDDNCNGMTDEGWVVTPTMCGSGICTNTGGMVCTAGVVSNSCVAGMAGMGDATCNNQDDDCDGTKDEDYASVATSCGVGACAAVGVSTCTTGVVGSTCMAGSPAATDATCNAIDDNCNGMNDENYAPTVTNCGVGACARTGATSCSGGAVLNSCAPGSPAGSDTTCNGIDDDCNGLVDDGYVSLTTACGVGACGRTGSTSCMGGAIVDSCSPGTPGASDTTCNNIDENCNGAKDEGFVVFATACGTGACAAAGFTTCSAGSLVNSCTPGAPAGSDSTCNNIDDDCNGVKDDGYAPLTTNCGVGACARTGATACVAGSVTNSCSAGTPAASDVSCNNIDDDCNGAKDDGYVVTATSCGVGACARTGFNTCSAGTVVNSCAAGSPAGSDTTCNNIDDDCNGAKDDGYLPVSTNCGVGACAATGVTACVTGTVTNSCVAGAPAANDATCNGVDEDCNGTKDEDFVASGTACGIGACAATGTLTCVAGSTVNSCMAGTPAAADTTCNGVDDNCNGTKDEDFVPTATSCGVGACLAMGTTSCVSGVPQNSCVAGSPAATDTTCNNIDENCNGTKDEGYAAMATACGVGACASTGVTSCSLGVVGNSCMAGSPGPSDATCDGVDNNCNGMTDEGYTATPTSCGVGGCANMGTMACIGGVPTNTCVPGTPGGGDATCNNQDDDCDGTKDEDYVPTATSCGVGACAAMGTSSCVAGVVQQNCSPGTPAATDLTCNNIDDNCNGTKDEGFPVTTTNCGVGACASTGTSSCVGGAVINSCMAGTPAASDTTCNNVDDNCNGTKDEGYPVTSTNCGVGACASTGSNTCVMGVVTNSCTAGTPAANDATCNNIDDDCNGARDEDYIAPTTNCGVGACARTGLNNCVVGVLTNTCTAGTPGASDTSCDGIDNNCNSAVDEGYTPLTTNCGTGACARNGVTSCVSGSTTDSCSPGAPAANDATCNNVDDDCSGATDEDFAGTLTNCGTGQCARTGLTTCAAGGISGNSCVPGMMVAEVCDGLDNDCNGVNDNGDPGSGASCATGNLGVCSAGIRHCIASTLQCVQTTASSTEVCDALDNNCDGMVNEGNPGSHAVCTVTGKFGPCASSTLQCLPADTSSQCRQTVFPNAGGDICAAGGGVGPGDGVDNDCDGSADNNPTVADASQLTCLAAGSSTFMVPLGGSVDITGNVTVSNGADYFLVNFLGVGDPTTGWHPKFTFTNGAGTYLMKAFTTTGCTTTVNTCGAGFYDTIEATYLSNHLLCNSSALPGHPQTCTDTQARITTYVLQVTRSAPTTLNCTYYTVHAQN